MCANGCDKKETCYRWMATPSHWQSVADFKPGKYDICTHYWHMDEDTKEKEEEHERRSL